MRDDDTPTRTEVRPMAAERLATIRSWADTAMVPGGMGRELLAEVDRLAAEVRRLRRLPTYDAETLDAHLAEHRAAFRAELAQLDQQRSRLSGALRHLRQHARNVGLLIEGMRAEVDHG